MLIIGSTALRHHGITLNRESLDVDIICTEDKYQAYKATNKLGEVVLDTFNKRVLKYGTAYIEFDIAQKGDTNSQLLEMFKGCLYAPLDVLYALKLSHRYKKDSPHFYKTMADIHLLRSYGASVRKDMEAWLVQREAETYTYNHPKLSVSKGDFFKDDEVPYVFDHDSLHIAVAYPDVPAYTLFKKEGEEVLCSKELFFTKATEAARLNSVYEEAAVLALERSLVPYGFKPCPDKMFRYALMKLCTSISSGWWREYAWENHQKVIDLHTELGEAYYVSQFIKGQGFVRPFKEKY